MALNQFIIIIRFVFHIINIQCLIFVSLSTIADCLISNCASWVQLEDANQIADCVNEKHKLCNEAIVFLDSDWLLSANNMETVP